MLLRRVVDILSENINRRSMGSSNYKYGLMMFSLKAAHFQVNNTTALSYLMKMGGDWKQGDDSSCQENLGIRPTSEDHKYCKVSARETECDS